MSERQVREGHTWPCPRFWDDSHDAPELVRPCTCREERSTHYRDPVGPDWRFRQRSGEPRNP